MRSIILIIGLLFFNAFWGHCNLQFEHFNTYDGLSNNSVRWIYQDKKGFLWFGTLNGLNRFDGKQFKSYSLMDELSDNLSNNRIIQIAEDSDQFLWVVTYDKKVHLINTVTNKISSFPFEIYPHETNYKTSLVPFYIKQTTSGASWLFLATGGCVRCVYNPSDVSFKTDTFNYDFLIVNRDMNFVHQDKLGGVWLGTKKGLSYLPNDTIDFNSNKVEHHFYDDYDGFTSYFEFENEIWFGTIRHGIVKYNLTTKQFSSLQNALTGKGIISSISADKKGNVLIGTIRDGVFFFDEKGQLQHFKSGDRGLQSSFINEIYCTTSGHFWFMTRERGVTMFDTQIQKFRYFPLSPDFREMIHETERIQFFEDSNQDFWIGNYGGGVFKYDENKKSFDHFYHKESNPASLSSNFILSMFEDNSKNLWIGTLNGGLNKINLSPNNFTNIRPDAESPVKYTNEVRALWCDAKGRTWVGTKGGILFCYNSKMEEVWNSKQSFQLKSIITSGIYCLQGDRNGNLWVGTKGNGAIVLKGLINDFNKGFEIVQFHSGSANATHISNNNVYSIIEDQLGQIWIGNYFGGLNVLTDPFTNPQFQTYWLEKGQKNTITDNRVRCLLQDKDKNLWIGTVEGLNYLPVEQLNKADKKFIPVNLNNRDASTILSNDILTINQGRDGKIRVGTFGGGLFVLEKMDVEKMQYEWHHYTTKEGLSGNVVVSMVEDTSGYLWVATDNGLNKLNKENNEFDTFGAAETIGTNNVFSENGGCITSDNRLVFGASDGFVLFNPSSIVKDNRHYPLIITSFKLFDEEVQPTNNSILTKSIELTNTITLNHDQNFFAFKFSVLDYSNPEKIQYQYMLENFEQEWIKGGTVNEAVYKNIAPGSYLFKVKSTNASNVWSDEVVQIEIVIKNPIWKTPWAYLIYVFVFVALIGAIIYIITHQLKLKNRVELEQQMTEDKIRFYTNISHEFKTPLTLILGPADKLESNANIDQKAQKQVRLIKQNALRLFELIEQLLEFRKVQKGAKKLNVSKIDIIDYCTEIFENFVPLAKQKEIQFEIVSGKEREGWFDRSCIEKILFNLLSNAFKNTKNGKCITLNVNIDNADMCSFSVIDEGIGIKPENITKIFERFSYISQTNSSNYSSSGIGLSFTKELVKLHKGEITVTSEYGAGSNFTVRIPCSKMYYSTNEIQESITDDKTNHNVTDALRYMQEETLNVYENQSTSKIMPLLLIIEDDKQLREFLIEDLSHKYRVIFAEEGLKGIEMAKAESPDLVISDVVIPNKDGFTITKELKSDFETCHIPVILLTGQSSDEHKIKGIEYGADDYITKPFNLKYLSKRVENILNLRKVLKEKFISEPGIKPNKLSDSKQDQSFISEVIRLTEEQMSKPDFAIDSIIREMGYGRTMFYKKMKTISGYAPREFIMIVRMKKAAVMLRETNATIKAVSEDIGFFDTHYFSKNFKNYFGELPSEYRKKFKN